MRYVLIISSEEHTHIGLDPEAHRSLMDRYKQVQADLEKAGARQTEIRLRSIEHATTVRVRAGKTLITDGPFVETKDRIGGIFVIDVADLDEAIEWAKRIPQAEVGSVEIRPVWELEEFLD